MSISKTINFTVPEDLNDSKINVKKVLNKSTNLHGPGFYTNKIKNFLKKKYNFKNVFLTNSCTSALEICAIALDFKENDEVIIPSYSFITTGGSFARTRAKLVYCDVDIKKLMPSLDDIETKISKKTKAIVIVHYQGFCVDYISKLKKICRKKNIFLIEDAAQALGSKYKNKYLGTYGDLACFSFHYSKNIHTGIGGCLVVNNKKLLRKCSFAFDKGSDRNLQLKKIVKWYSWVSLGSSFLMSELHASYLYPQLTNYNKIIYKRKKIYEKYIKELDIKNNYYYIIKNNSCIKYNYHALVIVLKNKNYEKLLKYLKVYNINAFIGYIPLHLSTYGKQFLKEKLNKLDSINDKIIRLPLHTSLTISDIMYISKKIKLFFKI